VQFVRDAETGEFVLLEINPRFWVSLSCAVEAGLDFPWYLWMLATTGAVPEETSYETGVATHLLRGELVHLHSVLRGTNPHVDPPPFQQRARKIAESVVDQPNFDYLSARDPGPFVRDVLNAATSLPRPAWAQTTDDSRPVTAYIPFL
jgi:predicted ATP-grasp superfamily ATP-dependent carboligase